MPIVFVIIGSLLVCAGLYFAIKGIAADKAGADGLKSFSVTGPSWLILIALGIGTIVGGSYLWKSEPTPSPAPPPATETTVEPFDYGDDPLLDSLYDACQAGSMGDCDDLFFNSPAESNYEAFGSYCGYASDTPTDGGCVATFDTGNTAVVGEPGIVGGPSTT